METHYSRIGGEEVVRKLVNHFYDLMDADPDYYGIRKLHQKDLVEDVKSYLCFYLAGWAVRNCL